MALRKIILFIGVLIGCCGLAGCAGNKLDLYPMAQRDTCTEIVIDKSRLLRNSSWHDSIGVLKDALGRSFDKIVITETDTAPSAGKIILKLQLFDCRDGYGSRQECSARLLVQTVEGTSDASASFGASISEGTDVAGAAALLFTLGAASIPIEAGIRSSVRTSVVNSLVNQIINKVDVAVEVARSKLLYTKPSQLVVNSTYQISKQLNADNVLDAGEEGEIALKIANIGEGSALGVKLEVHSDVIEVSVSKEIVLGEIQPGQTKDAIIPVTTSLALGTATARIDMKIREERGYDAEPFALKIPTAALQKPALSVAEIRLDDGAGGLSVGNGNGIPENGETIEMTVLVKNSGEGSAYAVKLNGSDLPEGVAWEKQSDELGIVRQGDTAKAKVVFKIPRNFSGSEVKPRLVLNEARGVGGWDKTTTVAIGTLGTDLKALCRILDESGREVKELVTGGSYGLEVEPLNDGKLSARDVNLDITPSQGLTLDKTSFSIGEIKQAGKAGVRKARLNVARVYQGGANGTIYLAMTQKDFQTVREKITLPVEVLAPRLRYEFKLKAQEGANVVRVRERPILEVRVVNDGALAAEGVTVALSPVDESLLVEGSKEATLGRIPPGGAAEARFALFASGRLKVGTTDLKVNLTQKDFSLLSGDYALIVKDSEARIETIAGDAASPLAVSRSAAAAGPAVEILRLKDGAELEEETIDLFATIAGKVTPENIKVKVNGVNADFVSSIQKDKTTVKSVVRLAEGENTIAVVAYSDAGSTTKPLKVNRKVSEDVDSPLAVDITNPKAVGVVIGVGKYQKEDVFPVQFAVNDAKRIKDTLTATLGYSSNRIYELYDEKATKIGIQDTLRRAFAAASKESDLFIYFSGHGSPDKNKKRCLLPHEATAENLDLAGIPLDDIYAQLEKLKDKVKSITVVLDTCYSGTSAAGPLIKGSAVSFESDESELAANNAAIFTAAAADQIANWYQDKKHGVFTYYFLMGLRGHADDDRSGRISAQEMQAYLLRNVDAQVKKSNPERTQTPQLQGNSELVLR